MPRQLLLLAGLLLVGAARHGLAAPVDGNAGAAAHGGGCYPPSGDATGLEALAGENPPWALVVPGSTTPVLVHGTVHDAHGPRGGEFPATHARGDVVAQVALDAADAGRISTADADGLLPVVWESGALPEWAWPSAGDRLTALGRWVFDCSRPAATLGYQTELHPPHALAVVRTGGGAALAAKAGAPVVPVTRADVFVNAYAGGAGDACILSHQAATSDLLETTCFPLAQPVANVNVRNFDFDVPLPPRPRRARARWRVLPHDLPSAGDVRAGLIASPHPGGRAPRIHFRVRLRAPVGTVAPTAYAATIVAGWVNDPTPLTHVRVTVEHVVVNNTLRPTHPAVPRECAVAGTPCDTELDCGPGEACLGQGDVRSWKLQVSVNGVWQVLARLDAVDISDRIAQTAVWDVWLPADGALHLVADGVAEDCREARVGHSLGGSFVDLGPTKLLDCLATRGRDPGRVDVTLPGPAFGAGATYETTSTGGDGGHCSLTTIVPCVVDDDCGVGETCVVDGGAFTLRYRIDSP